MRLMFNGKEYFGPRGPAGPDGNPIGTVISYLGLSAPQDYLICDGREYNLSDYPDLAEFLRTQFGTANHFGGDGETTFAVPDFRNLFLRGYHGEAEEQLSGEIGQRQEGTKHLNVRHKHSYITIPRPEDLIDAIETVIDQDKFIGEERARDMVYTRDILESIPQYYTSRPVNMAVLYCIKAVESVPAQDVYSTQETRIGTWINGKPIYRRFLSGTTADASEKWNTIAVIDNVDTWVSITGILFYNGLSMQISDSYRILSGDKSGKVSIYNTNLSTLSCPVSIIAEYTKTTDQGG